MPSKVMSSPSWAALPNEVLSCAFINLPFHSKITLELVCKAWREVLQNPQAGVWGPRLNVLNTSLKEVRRHAGRGCKEPIMQLPASVDHDHKVLWLSRRAVGFSQLLLGCKASSRKSALQPTKPDLLKQLFPAPDLAVAPDLLVYLHGK